MAAYSSDEILAQLDGCADRLTFPMLDSGHVYLVDTRLRAFADATRWAMAIEVLGYNPRAGRLDDALHLYGNCLSHPPGLRDENLLCVIGTALEDPECPEHLSSQVSACRVRDRELPISASSAPVRLVDFFRRLVPGFRDLFLASSEEIAARLPPDLPLLLQLEEWSHPDLARHRLPSETDSFQRLAEALARADASLYRPPRRPNTHWSHWPAGGAY